MSNSLWPQGLQHPRLPCPSQFPRVCLDSCNAIFFSAALFFCLQSFPASGFFNQLALHIRWLKYWSFSFSISPSNEYSGLISFRINWFDLLAVQRTLKSLLQHRNSKVSVLWPSAFFMGPLSHVYMTTGKTPALTIWTSVGKVISLLFNMLFRFVIAFLSRSKCLLISWQQSLCEVFLESKKNLSLFPLFPHLFAMKLWDQMPWTSFFSMVGLQRVRHNWATFTHFLKSGAFHPQRAVWLTPSCSSGVCANVTHSMRTSLTTLPKQ